MNQLNQLKKEKPIFTCQYCEKVYKNKKCFEKHFEKCQDEEIEIFNYESLIEHWHSLDPEIANAFQVEMQELLEKRG